VTQEEKVSHLAIVESAKVPLQFETPLAKKEEPKLHQLLARDNLSLATSVAAVAKLDLISTKMLKFKTNLIKMIKNIQ
jgi:hypothetical protein